MSSSQRIPGHRFLHSPGPTRVPDAVLNAMHCQPMDLADPRVDALIDNCEHGLKKLLHTGNDVFMYAANGHGAWEAVVANLAAPGQVVLVAGTGHFSESWALQTEAMGVRVVRTPWREGLPIDPQAIEEALRADSAHDIVAVFAVHTDTASGMTSDLTAVRRAIDAAGHPALMVVDVVASLAAEPFAMDALGANVALGASQKGLMVPPGLAFVAVDKRAMEVAQRNTSPRYYWDWTRRQNPLSYRKFCGTPPMNLLMGLEASLGLIFQEGLAEVLERHRLIARTVHAAVNAWSEGGAVKLFVKNPEALSVSVTTVQVSSDIDPEALRSTARERFQVAIAGGLGPQTGKAFRIGHLGDMNSAMILGCLGGVEAAMRVHGIAVGKGGMQAAIDVLAG
ncbi:MAG: aminotransferase class V-fold PLP-dependent enzyme [Rhodoferax sp.]|nr:aminotransferase class V-fold PLP-dependent enzyme [Rhodoferax sp.]